MVWATDPETGESAAREVTAVWPHDDLLVELETSVGGVVTTEDHHFWNEADREWAESRGIDLGDELLTIDGTTVSVVGLDWSTATYEQAFDLTVDETHTYYVTVGDDDTPVLVHNCDGDDNCDCGVGNGLGVNDPPSRVHGPWTRRDHGGAAVNGATPGSLGRPELHHADQMPGSGIHEVDPVAHRQPGVHNNMWNQGVDGAMRDADRKLHWWYPVARNGRSGCARSERILRQLAPLKPHEYR